MQNTRFKLRTRLILSIVLPALVCFSISDFYILKMTLVAGSISKEMSRTIVTQNIWVFGASFVVLLIAVLLAAHAVVKPVKLLTGYAARLADGNTDFKVATAQRSDEFGELSRSIRANQLTLKKVSLILGRAYNDILVGNLSVRADADKYPGDFGRIMDGNNKVDDSICGLIRNIKTAAENMASVTQQMSSGAQSVAHGATEQAAAIEEISVTVADVLERTKSSCENADKTRALSEKVSAEVRKAAKK